MRSEPIHDGAQGVASGPRARRTERTNRNVLQVREDSEHRTNAAPGPRSSPERNYPWMAAATITQMPSAIAATTTASAMFCFSTISCHRS
jgi:hypothetical protein